MQPTVTGGRWDGVRPILEPSAAGVASLAMATAIAAVLETGLGVTDASPVYLLAVLVMAARYGTWPAVGTSVAALLIYDFLFTAPRYSLTVADPQEWLSLLLFLVMAVVIGRLGALLATRAVEADARAAEAQAMFSISRSLATTPSVRGAAREIVERLCAEARMDRVWIGAGPTTVQEQRLADSAADRPMPAVPLPWTLHRTPGDEPAAWVRTHTGRPAVRAGADVAAFRVVMAPDGRPLGSVWGLRSRSDGLPGRAATRILSLVADQIGLALRREELAAEATSAAVARRSDALKSALLDSVSHDLRTPLATIRALAGGLVDDEVALKPGDARRAAAAIDDEAARLSEIVRSLLDMTRIEGGAVRAELEVHNLDDLVADALKRRTPPHANRMVTIDVSPDLPPVLVDALYLDQALSNVLENAARYAGPDAPIRIGAALGSDDADVVDLVVEDGGPGVPEEELPRVFEKFFRGPQVVRGRPTGLGIGLSVARGLTEAMGGQMTAERSALGGLAIRIRLPVADAAEAGAMPTVGDIEPISR
jgi:two-component system, OmpR family, sensor histidine kinase KdpD